MRRAGVGVGVLLLEVRDHLGVGLLAHPLERIDHGVPVEGPFGGAVRGGGDGGELGGHPPRVAAPSCSRGRATPSTRGPPAEPGGTSMPSSEVQAKTAGYSPSGTFSAGL